MKRLLSLIGAISIGASTSATVVACGTKNTQLIDSNNEQDKSVITSKLMSQTAKALFMNQNENIDYNNKHISTSSILTSLVQNKTLSELNITEVGNSNDINVNSKFNDVYNTYFDKNLMAKELNLSDNIYQSDVKALDNETIESLKKVTDLLPTILNLCTNPSSLGQLLLMLAKDPSVITNLISEDTLKSLAKVLDNDTLKLFEKAFSSDIYKDMTYQDSLDSSVIGLANAVNNLFSNEGSDTLKYDTKDDINSNYDKAIDSLANNISYLMSGEKTISFDITKNIKAIPEVIRFVRTLLLPLDQFKFEDITSRAMTLNEVGAMRDTKIVSNKIDIKNIFNILNALSTDNEGFILKNIVNFLLGTDDKLNISYIDAIFGTVKYKGNKKGGLIKLVSKFVEKLNKADFVEFSVVAGLKVKISIDFIIRAFLNMGLGQNKDDNGLTSYVEDGTITADTLLGVEALPDFLKNVIKAVNENNDWNKFALNWVGYLWNNDNKHLNLSLKSYLDKTVGELVEMFQKQPTDKALGFDHVTNNALDMIFNKKLSDIFKDLKDSTEKVEKSTVDFDTLANLFKSMYENDALQNALNDVNHLFKHLGLNDDGSFVESSVLSNVIKMGAENKDWLTPLIGCLDNYINEETTNLSTIKEKVYQYFKKLTVDIEINAENDFIYKVSDGKITNIFNIKLKTTNSKAQISEIRLLKN